MNAEILKGQWNQLKGDVMVWWGELTKDEVEKTNGERIRLEGLIEERFGKTKEEAKKEVDQFFHTQATMKGKWNQLRGSAQYMWGKLTGSDLDQVEGGLTTLFGRLQEKYGKGTKEIRDEIIDLIENTKLDQKK